MPRATEIILPIKKGQMFEDELDLAYAVISGVEARGITGGYSVERFRFNSS
jgi:putative transposase